MKNSIKAGALLAAAIFLTSTGVNATAARSAGMGINQANAWAVEGQLPYLYTNPAAMGYFAPIIYGETDTTGAGTNGGIIFQMAPSLNIGVFIGQLVDGSEIANVYGNYNAAVDKTTTQLAGFGATFGAPMGQMFTTGPTSALANQNAQVIAQLSLGSMLLGAGVSYGGTSENHTADNTAPTPLTTESLSLSESVINAVLGIALNLDKVKIDASAAYRIASVNNVYNFNDTTNSITRTASFVGDGSGDILIDAQGIFDFGKNVLHAQVGFDILNGSSKSTSSEVSAAGAAADTTEDLYSNTGTTFRAGLSDEIKISKDIFAFVGASFNLTSRTTTPDKWTQTIAGVTTNWDDTNDSVATTTTTTMTLPIFLGMEANLGENWQARFGVSANLLNETPGLTNNTITATTPVATKSEGSTDFWSNAAPAFATGLSLKITNFAFDWNISIPLLTTGPNFIGGGAPGLATQFAISYKFGEPAKK